ncbi:MAG: ATP-binding cassette domain-containing protein [Gemmatimonadales bacterium]
MMTADSIQVAFGERQILRSAFIDAIPGVVTALIGRSGSGKTTLFRIIEGTARPDGGTVRWDGRHLRRPTLHQWARMGLVSLPSGAWLPDHLASGEVTRTVAGVWGSDPTDLLDEVGLGSIAGQAAASLSGGERRLAEIGVALAACPSTLILDEPFRGLAPIHRDALGALLRRRASQGLAVLFADHDVTSVLEFADRVYSLEAGRTRLVDGFRERPVEEWYHLWPTH